MKSSRAQRGKELIIGPGNKQVRINNELASACVCVGICMCVFCWATSYGS